MEKSAPIPASYDAPPQYNNEQPSQWDHIPALEGAPPAANSTGSLSSGSGPSDAGAPAHAHAHTPSDPRAVALNRLLREPQYVDCPNCKQRAQTKVQGRSKGKQQFMNVFWWPLPHRRTWWEKTHWFCSNCDVELAMQKDGKELQVLV